VSSLVVIMYKQWPLHAPVLNYPEFRYLHHLKFILPCFNLNLLVNVLKKCCILQVLIVQSNKVCLHLKFDWINLPHMSVCVCIFTVHKQIYMWVMVSLVAGSKPKIKDNMLSKKIKKIISCITNIELNWQPFWGIYIQFNCYSVPFSVKYLNFLCSWISLA
jgi:hypothetical protein